MCVLDGSIRFGRLFSQILEFVYYDRIYNASSDDAVVNYCYYYYFLFESIRPEKMMNMESREIN